MEKTLLFTRKYNKETYKFYLNKDIYSEYITVETPENFLGYKDIIFFNKGKAYTLYRYIPNWIFKKITETLVKKGYSDYIM